MRGGRQETMTTLKEMIESWRKAITTFVNTAVKPIVEAAAMRAAGSLDTAALERKIRHTEQLIKYTKHSKKRQKHIKQLKLLQEQLATMKSLFEEARTGDR